MIWPQYGMTNERFWQVFNDINDKLTVEEEKAGWYFSTEYDGLLVNRYWEGHELTDGEWGV